MSATAILEPSVTAAPVSDRQAVQNRLVAFLHRNADRWTAPFGIDSRVVSMPRGGTIRCIHFGVRNCLTVRVDIHSPVKIVVSALGELGSIVSGVYETPEAFESAVHRLLRDVP